MPAFLAPLGAAVTGSLPTIATWGGHAVNLLSAAAILKSFLPNSDPTAPYFDPELDDFRPGIAGQPNPELTQMVHGMGSRPNALMKYRNPHL